MTEYISVVTTTGSEGNAQQIASAALENRLAACVQISAPIESRYWWQGKIETAQEWRLTIKTRTTLFDDLTAAIRAVHPYSVPQILALPVVAGNRDYFAWIDEVTTPPTEV
jgi:periplasmic divalent cation tolerance protein